MLLALLLCGCKSKHTAIKSAEDIKTDVSVLVEKTEADTTTTKSTEQVNSWELVSETITIKEYDVTGNVSKETKTERKVAQAFNKVVAEETERRTASGITEGKHVERTEQRNTEIKEEIEPTTWEGLKIWGIIGVIIVVIWVMIIKNVRIKV